MILAATVLLSCKKDKVEDTALPEVTFKELGIKKASWLLGNWGNTDGDAITTESWKKINDSVYHGESFVVVKNDTVFAETVVLEQNGSNMGYTVSVPGQNNEKPVHFDMTSIGDKTMVFENPTHDFPNKITYTNVAPDSLVAVISGIKKGKPASETFAMSRLK